MQSLLITDNKGEGELLKNKGTVRELKFSKEKLLEVKDMMDSNKFSPYRKKHLLKDSIGVSPCGLCSGIPDIEISYQVGDQDQKIIRVEHFCTVCYRVSLEREKEKPKDKIALADFYNCIVAPDDSFGRPKQ